MAFKKIIVFEGIDNKTFEIGHGILETFVKKGYCKKIKVLGCCIDCKHVEFEDRGDGGVEPLCNKNGDGGFPVDWYHSCLNWEKRDK